MDFNIGFAPICNTLKWCLLARKSFVFAAESDDLLYVVGCAVLHISFSTSEFTGITTQCSLINAF